MKRVLVSPLCLAETVCFVAHWTIPSYDDCVIVLLVERTIPVPS